MRESLQFSRPRRLLLCGGPRMIALSDDCNRHRTANRDEQYQQQYPGRFHSVTIVRNLVALGFGIVFFFVPVLVLLRVGRHNLAGDGVDFNFRELFGIRRGDVE